MTDPGYTIATLAFWPTYALAFWVSWKVLEKKLSRHVSMDGRDGSEATTPEMEESPC